MTRYTYTDVLAQFGVSGAHPGGLSFTKTLLQQLNITKAATILDAGCGTGQTLAYLAKTFDCEPIGIDKNEMMAEKARQRMRNENLRVNVIDGNIEQMPFPEQSFDIILSESVAIFTNITRTSAEYARVLKPGGQLLAIELTKKEAKIDSALEQEFCQFYEIAQLPTKVEWVKLFSQAGFSKVAATEYELEHSATDEEFYISDIRDTRIYDVLDKHVELMELMKDHIVPIVYHCLK